MINVGPRVSGNLKFDVETICSTEAQNLTFKWRVNEFAAVYTVLKHTNLWTWLPRLARMRTIENLWPHLWTGRLGELTPCSTQDNDALLVSSTTGTLHMAWLLNTGNIVSLSVQQFVVRNSSGSVRAHGHELDFFPTGSHEVLNNFNRAVCPAWRCTSTIENLVRFCGVDDAGSDDSRAVPGSAALVSLLPTASHKLCRPRLQPTLRP